MKLNFLKQCTRKKLIISMKSQSGLILTPLIAVVKTIISMAKFLKISFSQDLKVNHNFYKIYRFVLKEKMKESPHLAYIRSCEEKGIVPIPLGTRKDKNEIDGVVLNNISMGDEYAEALSQILPFKQTGFSLSLSNNRITQKGADKIVEKLNQNISSLDFSFNPNIKYLNFKKLISNRSFKLTKLNLEGNQMGDNVVVKLSNAIIGKPGMQVLNLSQNMITNKGALSLAELIRYTHSLQALYIKWNFIKARGGSEIIDAITENTSLMVLEMSFNPLGENKAREPKPLIDKADLDPNMIINNSLSQIAQNK